jgi:Fe-S-cluster containining protein
MSALPPIPPGRAALQRHVLQVQRSVRTCAGCGLCCTEPWNTLQVLPWEAQRIVRHLSRLEPARREALLERARAAVARHGLQRARGLPHYTCSFLEPDLRCALPLSVKPAACLSFNPLTPDRCDQQPEWFARAGAEALEANRRAGLPGRRRPIPAAVLEQVAAESSRPARRRARHRSGPAP